MMEIITIKNVGPIKEVINLALNRVNVFMGQQGSGKSTLAKIISYCVWVEKVVATSQSLKTYQENKTCFREQIESFHKLKGYFSADSYISYKSDVVEITWENEQNTLIWVDQYAYKRSKISYIPAERNMAILPDIRQVEFGNNNVRSFLFDWFNARKKFPENNRLSIMNLGVDYYYLEGNMNEENRIKGLDNDREYDILLSNASSGMQSIIPLVAMVEYVTRWIHLNDNTSFEQQEKLRKVSEYMIDETVLKPYFKKEAFTPEERSKKIEKFNDKLRENDLKAEKYFSNFIKLRSNLFDTQNSQFIIEEPEQNLFPETQRDLIYYLLEKCLNKDSNRLTITTHSPYILYALNNCMMSGMVYERMSAKDRDRLKCRSSNINPENVSIYEIHDGILTGIQQPDGLIGENFFDRKMKELMDDFYLMINYYGR